MKSSVSLVRRLWLGETEVPFGPPYTLTPGDRRKFSGTFGVDVSHYTFDIDTQGSCKTEAGYLAVGCSCRANWDVLANNGIRYVYAKASDGRGFDLSFPRIWAELEGEHTSRRIFRGAYHFLRPGVDTKTQASTFLQSIGATGGRKPAQLSPALDVERSNKRVFPGSTEFEMCPKNRLIKDKKDRYFCDMWYTMSSKEIIGLIDNRVDL